MAPHALSDNFSFDSSNRPDHAAAGPLVEAVAVVGFSIGFPNGINTDEDLWRLMLEKRNTVTRFPEDRISSEAFYHPHANRKGQFSVRHGHFIKDDLAAFDASFFLTSMSDAAIIDPQHRQLLMHTYKALENAGIPMETVAGTNTSVFSGSFCIDWLQMSYMDTARNRNTTALGVGSALNANRISWFFDFIGNSATIDTACSSSLVCLDLGCQNLRLGESQMSIVTGSNIILSPDIMHTYTSMNMISPDGQCYSFDHRGNGYGRGEGTGVLILKRLSDAVHDGDTIRGIIRSTGSNQDGRVSGITLPNPVSQAMLIKNTYKKAGLSMEPVRFFEAHGTGTPVGDPSETQAIGEAFKGVRTTRDPLWVGSVKSNLGHLEGASGIAGVVKALLVLERGIIPPNTNFEKTNPNIDTDFLRIKFPHAPLPWPTKGLRRASVNSFGNTGTNAHVVLDDVYHFLQDRGIKANHLTVKDPPKYAHCSEVSSSASHAIAELIDNSRPENLLLPKLLVLSANDHAGVQRLSNQYAIYFEKLLASDSLPDEYLDHLSYTLSRRRSQLAWKSYAIIRSIQDLARLDNLFTPAIKHASVHSLAFVFSGQGAQWTGMGRALASNPVFVRSLQRSEQVLGELGCTWNLREKLWTNDSAADLSPPHLSQAICTALQIALVDLLREYGILPSAVVGHSSGEIAAAYCIGAVSHYSSIALAYHRGKLCSLLDTEAQFNGAMLAVALAASDLERYMGKVKEQYGSSDLTIACFNSPRNVTVSGTKMHIDALSGFLNKDGIFCRLLRVNVAYHSSHMQYVAEMYRASISKLEKGRGMSKPVPAFFSSLRGDLVRPEELALPQYWIDNLVSPVYFSDVMQKLLAGSDKKIRKKLDLSHRRRFRISMIIEVGPHSTLQAPIKEIVAEVAGAPSIKYTSLLIRNAEADDSLLNAVGQIYSFGYPVDLACVNGLTTDLGSYKSLPDLPSYVFELSKRYWLESRISSRTRLGSQGKIDLLGKPVADWNPLEPKWRNFLRISEMPWMEDHAVANTLIYPGSGMVVMAIEAANQLTAHIDGIEGFSLRNVSFVRTLNIPQDADGIETNLTMSLAHDELQPLSKWTRWRLTAYEQGAWHECCHGEVRANLITSAKALDSRIGEMAVLDLLNTKARRIANACTKKMDVPLYYKCLKECGLDAGGLYLGPAFQRIVDCQYGEDNEVVASLKPFRWPAEQYPQTHVIHPTTLDCIFHTSLGGYSDGGHQKFALMIPSFLRHLKVSKAGAAYTDNSQVIHEYAWLDSFHARGVDFSGFVLDTSREKAVVEFEGLKVTQISENNTQKGFSLSEDKQMVYSLQYMTDPTLIDSEEMSAYCDESEDIHQTALAQYIALQSHRDPDLNILVLDTDDAYVVRETFPALWRCPSGQTQIVTTFGSLHVIAPANSLWEEFRTQSGQDLPFIQHPAESQDLFYADDRNIGFFNTILVRADVLQDMSILKRVRSLLRDDGELVIVKSSIADEARSDHTSEKIWSHNLAKCGFASEYQQMVDNRTQFGSIIQIRVIKAQQQQPPEKQTRAIYLVVDLKFNKQVQAAHQLAASLGGHKFSIGGVITLARAAELSKDENGIFIVLLEYERPLLYQIPETVYGQLQQFLTSSSNIIWINAVGGSDAAPPEHSMILGLARALRNEFDNLRITVISLESSDLLSERQVGHVAKVLLRNHVSQTSKIVDSEYLEIGGELTIPRLVPEYELAESFRVRATTHRSIMTTVTRELPLALSNISESQRKSMHFVHDQKHDQPLREDEIQIQVQALGINAKDILPIAGRHLDHSQIYECAGVVVRTGSHAHLKQGDRVLTTTSLPPSTHVRVESGRAVVINDQVSYATAAAIPVHFGTAWAIVQRLAQLQESEVILVHAAAISHGQAIIQMAQQKGAEVYCTVRSLEEQQLLVDAYGTTRSHIFIIGSDNFEMMIRHTIGESGVDVLVDCAVKELMKPSLNWLKPFGRLIEVGRRVDTSDLTIPLAALRKGISFHNFDFVTWSQQKPEQYYSDLHAVMELFMEGKLVPVSPSRTFDIGEVQQAYESIQKNHDVGKVLLEVTPASRVLATLKTSPSFRLDPNATYVVAGGLGGTGRTTAQWMADRGARSLILLSRSGPRNEDAHALVKKLTAAGVLVQTPACDVSDLEQLTNFIASVKDTVPPIKGCVQATLVARDCLFKDMSFEDWRMSVECKTTGSWNLHFVLPREMDFFILLSSSSGLIGVKGQSNYDAGNTYEDALARWRVIRGEKAVALDLGALVDDGYLVEHPELLKRVLAYGALESVTREKYLGLLDYYCDPSRQFPSPRAAQVVVGMSFAKGSGLETLNLSRQALLLPLLRISRDQAGETTQEEHDDSRALFIASETLDQASQIVCEAIQFRLGHSLSSMQEDAADVNTPLVLQGVDSLLAIELRDWIAREFACELAIFETQGAATLYTLSTQVAGRSVLPHPNWTMLDSE